MNILFTGMFIIIHDPRHPVDNKLLWHANQMEFDQMPSIRNTTKPLKMSANHASRQLLENMLSFGLRTTVLR